MANEVPCGKCANYDPIIRGSAKITKRGWCIPRSKYRYEDAPGQVIPPNAERVTDETALAEPFIVRRKGVEPTCVFVRVATEADWPNRKLDLIQKDMKKKPKAK